MRIRIQEKKNQLLHDISELHKIESNHQKTLRTLQSAVIDYGLQGKAYDAWRDRVLSYDIPLIQGLLTYISYLTCLYGVHLQYISFYFDDNQEELDERTLSAQIRIAYRRLGRLFRYFDTDLIGEFNPGIETEKQQIIQLINELNKRLVDMNIYNDETQALYNDANDLATTLKQGAKFSGSIIWLEGWQAPVGYADISWLTVLAQQVSSAWRNTIKESQRYVFNNEVDRYGGSQRGPYMYFMRNEDGWKELDSLLQRFPVFKDFGKDEERILLNRISDTGCGYVALANIIMENYYFRPDDFLHDFGFPLFRNEGSQTLLNYEYLIVEMYCSKVQYGFDRRIADLDEDGYPMITYRGLSIDEPFASWYVDNKTAGRQQITCTDISDKNAFELLAELETKNVVVYTTDTTYSAINPAIESRTQKGKHAVSLLNIDISGEEVFYFVSNHGNQYLVTDVSNAYVYEMTAPYAEK